MFFGSRKRKGSADGVPRAPGALTGETSERASRQWRVWRRSAQSVTRAWNEWLAGDAPERPELYRRYVSTLDEEELAAIELEHTIELGTHTEDAEPTLKGAC